ncbi:SNF1-interacting protein [Coemansia brasiliensis]|uniref:SNF1-interacting protein n=1 Tax=Coemansia brasiliensis TaxID=2650707 RepID=A0A9W8IFP2_9FUNG|nr:SNF1-interacting protein [Coemansia brasiliensis]
MGNAAGKLNGVSVCDGGSLSPNGIYPQDAQDFDVKVVQRMILARQLAPFYTGADDPDPDSDQNAGEDDGWWSYNLLLAQQLKDQSNSEISPSGTLASSESPPQSSPPAEGRRSGHVRKGSGIFQRLRASAANHNNMPASPMRSSPIRHERSFSDMAQPSQLKQEQNEQSDVSIDAFRKLLRRHIECPICFLYYPKNINYTRCCHKPICTECFVQIKRKLDDDQIVPTHCPYCVETNLGVVYHAPTITNGMAPTDSAARPRTLGESGRARSHSSATATRKPIIVMSDDIRPNRVRELRAQIEVKHKRQLRSAENMEYIAAATRRMSARDTRQQGSGNSEPRFSLTRGRRGSSALARADIAAEYSSYLNAMHAAGHTDLEEFMIAEAIRQSLANQPADSAPADGSAPRSPADALPEHRGNTDEPENLSENGLAASFSAHDDDSAINNDVPDTEMQSLAISNSQPVVDSQSTTSPSSSPSSSPSLLTNSESELEQQQQQQFVSATSMTSEFTAENVEPTSNIEPAVYSQCTESVGSTSTSQLSTQVASGTDDAQGRSTIPEASSMAPVVTASPTSAEDDPLSFEPFELDAIASISSAKRKRRPPPPPPSAAAAIHRPGSPSSSQTLTPSMMPSQDLMSFAEQPANTSGFSITNPFLATVAGASSSSVAVNTRAANAGASPPTSPVQRHRRRPPPPPPSASQHVAKQ